MFDIQPTAEEATHPKKYYQSRPISKQKYSQNESKVIASRALAKQFLDYS